MAVDKKRWDINLLRRVIRLALPYRSLFIFALVLAVVIAPLSTLRPYLIKVMVDDYIFKFDLTGLRNMVFVIAGVLFCEVIIRYFFIYTTNLLGQSVIKNLRVSVFSHIGRLKLRYFDTTPIGTSITRTINDIEAINNVFSQGVITIVADLLILIAVLVMMFYTSVRLTLICLITMPFMILATYFFKEKVKAAYQKVRTQISRMNAFLQERITGMRIVQIFNAEDYEMNKFKKINHDYTQANLDSILYYAVFFPVVELISAVSLALMIWWGANGVFVGQVSIGAIVAFPLYLSMLFRPMRMLADKFNTLQMGLVAADRVFLILDRDDHIKNEGKLAPERIQGQLEFQNVSFAYNDQDYVLKDVSFEVEKGKTLAVVGNTGSGKTTIINLLNRFYPIQKGQVLIDGINAKEYELYQYRRQIAVVLQDVFLFSGSVMENITLRDPSISKEKVIEASRMIGAHDFIQKLPGGYDYEVMERGATLSLGQRQIISFVRALVFDPAILILDEATSSVDPETEAVIQYAIEQLIAKRTSIIIAHRLTTIRHADKILLMDKGKVAEMGRHEELMKIKDGKYKKLYEMQFTEASSLL